MQDKRQPTPWYQAWWFWLAALIAFLFLISDGVENTKQSIQTPQPTASLETQQTDYKEWRNRYDELTDAFDKAWTIWEITIDGLAKGNVDRYSAYSHLSKLEDLLLNYEELLIHLDAPESLSKRDKELLDESVSALGDAAYSRRRAVKIMLNWLDDPRPSTLEEAKSEVQLSNSYLIDAVGKPLIVEESLGLTQQQDGNQLE